jgi:tryptophan 2,3-dioxygenase
MTTETIQSIQEYLTVSHDHQSRKIVNVEVLLRRHGPEPVIYVLKRLYKEKGEILAKLMEKDKSSSKIDEVIAAMFRIHMAIKEIEKWAKQETEGKEVKLICQI